MGSIGYHIHMYTYAHTPFSKLNILYLKFLRPSVSDFELGLIGYSQRTHVIA